MIISKANLPCTPEEACYNPERLDFLDRYYTGLIEKGELQGAMYGMARNGKHFVTRAMGRRRYDEEADPIRFDSIRRIASVTKLFTAVGIWKLIEDGLTNTKEPVCNYLEE